MPHYEHSKLCFTSEVYVVYKNKVLLRHHDKYKKWLSVGGHIDIEGMENPQDPNQAAVREVTEEVGLDVELYRPNHMPDIQEEEAGQQELIPPAFMNRHTINKGEREHVTFVYFASAQTDKLVLSEDEVAEDVHWFTHEELDDPKYGIDERVKIYAREALKILSK